MRKMTNFMLALLFICGVAIVPVKADEQNKLAQSEKTASVENPDFSFNRSAIFTESFEAWPAPGWTTYNLGATARSWESSTTAYAGSRSAHHRFGGSADGYYDTWLVSSAIVLGSEEYYLTFYERFQWLYDYEYSGVYISTGSDDPNDLDFVELLESPVVGYANTTWYKSTINLNAYANQTIYLAFVYRGTFAHSWWIDEVSIAPPPPPEFSITPVNWDFGIGSIGEPVNKIFTIQNTGGGTLPISNIIIEGIEATFNEFTFTAPETIELGAGETAEVVVTFTPKFLGARSANLIINSDARSEYMIPLTGIGMDLSNNIASQEPSYENGRNSTITAAYNYITADNFRDIDSEIVKVSFTALLGGTVNPLEPFFIRFYEYAEGYVPGLEAPFTGTFVLALRDQYDHWNWGGGSFVSVYVNGIPVIENAIMLSSNPNPKYYAFEANAGDEISTVYTPGSWASENYYAIMTEEGDPTTILAEQGGTWNNPGVSTPGSILPGSIQVLEPDWNNPIYEEEVLAETHFLGAFYFGYPAYNVFAQLAEPVFMQEGWFSAQYNGLSGDAWPFFWVISNDGDGIAFQADLAARGLPTRDEKDNGLFSDLKKSNSRGPIADDLAFELYGPSTLIPLSNWALYLGILLMVSFVVIRFRRMM